MSRRNRYDAEGNYLLPSERPEEVEGGDESPIALPDGGPYRSVLHSIYQPDAIDQMDAIRRQHPGAIDQLEHKALLQQQQRAQANERAPFARICPPSFGTAGSIGNQSVALLAGQTAQLAQWAADVDIESATIGITVAPVLPLQPNAEISAAILRIRGILQLGTRNMTTQVKFDVGNGISFNVGASYIGLLVALDPIAPPFTLSGPPVHVSGWLSHLPLPKTQPPTFTEYFDNAQTGAPSAILPRPGFAVEILPVQMSSASGSCNIEFFDVGRHLITQLAIPSPGAQVANIPWPNDAIGYRVTNTTLGTSQNIRVIHALAL